MVAVIDFRSTAPVTRGDLTGLNPYLSQLISEPFLFARESYGGELTLHFGREIELKPFRGLRLTEGTHILCLRASVWAVKSVPWGASVSSEDADVRPGGGLVSLRELEARPLVTPGERIIRIDARAFHGVGWPGGIELGLWFSDNSFLEVRPRYDPDDPVHDLADWELFTPYNRYIKAGPGVQWEYSPSDRAAPAG